MVKQRVYENRTRFGVLVERLLYERLSATPRQTLEFSLYVIALLQAAPTRTSLATGLVISSIGLSLRFVASGFRYSESEFMVRGPYRFVRHPHFLGSLILAVGICVGALNLYVAIGAFVTLGIFYQTLIRKEEIRLARNWGPRYGIFKANVSSIVPQLIPVVPAGGEGMRFSIKNSLFRGRMREINALLAAVVVFGCLYWALFTVNRPFYFAVISGISGVFLLFRFFYYGYAGKARQTRGVVSASEL